MYQTFWQTEDVKYVHFVSFKQKNTSIHITCMTDNVVWRTLQQNLLELLRKLYNITATKKCPKSSADPAFISDRGSAYFNIPGRILQYCNLFFDSTFSQGWIKVIWGNLVWFYTLCSRNVSPQALDNWEITAHVYRVKYLSCLLFTP